MGLGGLKGLQAAGMTDTDSLDQPWDRLAPLPRELWLPGLVTSVGDAGQRLADIGRWQAHLLAGALPLIDEGMGKVRVAFFPVATCSCSPPVPVSSTAAMP